MQLQKALAAVILALKKKGDVDLANNLIKALSVEALGLDLDVDVNISEDELEKELSDISQYIPQAAVGYVEDSVLMDLAIDVFASYNKVTTEIIEATADANNIEKEKLEDCIYEITQSLFTNESQVDENKQTIYSKDGYPSKKAHPKNITKEAAILWRTEVWPKFKGKIQNAGGAESQWKTAVNILKKMAAKMKISVYPK